MSEEPRRSKRIKFLQGVDYSNEKFQSVNHVQLVCDFLFISEMLALRLVNSNLKNKVDLLKGYAGQRVRRELEKIVGKDLMDLVEQEKGLVRGGYMLQIITGLDLDKHLYIRVPCKQSNHEFVQSWSTQHLCDPPYSKHMEGVCVSIQGIRILLRVDDETPSSPDRIPFLSSFLQGRDLVIFNPVDLVEKRFTYILKRADLQFVSDSWIYHKVDRLYKLGFECRNLSYQFKVIRFNPNHNKIELSMYRINYKIVFAKARFYGSTAWWGMEDVIGFLVANSKEVIPDLIKALNQVGFRFPYHYASRAVDTEHYLYLNFYRLQYDNWRH